MTLSESLKRFRREYNLTQKQVADAAGVNLRLYQKYESGQTTPATTTIVEVANHFKVSADYLLGLNNSLSNDENQLINSYRKLDSYGRRTVTDMANFLNMKQGFSTGNNFISIGSRNYVNP